MSGRISVVRKLSAPSVGAYCDRVLLLGCQPVSAASAAVFRITFGLLGFAAVCRFAAKGWISELYIEPAYHFTYSGFW